MIFEPLGTRPLPLCVRPQSSEQSARAALHEWLVHERAKIDKLLLETGALLFRGFQLREADDFSDVVEALGLPLREYVGGNSPRTRVLGRIYTSTEYPASVNMPLHNELAFANSWPDRILFYCVTPPAVSGETPIMDCRAFASSMSAETRALFERRRIAYVRNLRSSESLGVGKTWQDSFGTTDRHRVEEICRETGSEYRWNDDGTLWTRTVRRALVTHPPTGHLVWFNQILLFHPSSLTPKMRDVHAILTKRDQKPLDCCFEDGSAISPAILEELALHAKRHEVTFPWEQGDVLLLDNMLVAHGRRSFTGPRRILVAMA